MFSLIAFVIGAFFALGVALVIVLAVSKAKDAAHKRRVIERQFNAARWWHDNRDALKRMGVEEREFKQQWQNHPYEQRRGDINPPPRPDRRQETKWVDRDFPEPPQRFA